MSRSILTAEHEVQKNNFDQALAGLYPQSLINQNRTRLFNLLQKAEKQLDKNAPAAIISAPGRTELGGNHTDHNRGRVLAGAVHLDILAVAVPCSELTVTIHSSEFEDPVKADLASTAPVLREEGTSAAIVRGVADGFLRQGLAVGGFCASVTSTIPMGAGLSSSAAFEVLIGRIFNHLFNGDKVDPLDIARIAHRAENIHFGKPCGFMDQIACAFEGVQSIDFNDPHNPVIKKIKTDFSKTDYRLCVLNTGGSHADLTPDYSSIPEEMHQASQALGVDSARDMTLEKTMQSIPLLRRKCSDRAILRLLHFLDEDKRAVCQADALQNKDMDTFLKLTRDSGSSSRSLLQNCFSPSNPLKQAIPLALTLTEKFLDNHKGCCRVHGGGFAGTIQVYIPKNRFAAYQKFMNSVFGSNALIPLFIRQPGRHLLHPHPKG